MVRQADFERFLRNIEPSKTAKTEISSIQENVRAFLRNSEQLRGLYVDSFLSGSHAKNTAIRKTKYAGKGDVDIIVALSCSVNDDSTAIFNKLSNTLESSKRYCNVRIQHHSVRVEMKGIDVDIVPAIREAPDSNRYYIGSSKENSWTISDPKGHLAWATKMNDNANYVFKPLVKMFKWWRLNNCPNNIKYPKGIALEKIIADNCRISSKNYGDIFMDTLGAIATNYSGCKNKPFIADPCILNNNLLESYEDTDFCAFIQMVTAHYELLRSNNVAWVDIFGNAFTDATNQDDSTTEEFVEDKFAINPIFNLQLDGRVSQNGFRPFLLSQRKVPLLHGLKIEFIASATDIPKPYDIYWKIRNVGREAQRRNCIRGQIVKTNSFSHIEYSQFNGPHFAECYIVKDGVCIAKARIAVPIRQSSGSF